MKIKLCYAVRIKTYRNYIIGNVVQKMMSYAIILASAIGFGGYFAHAERQLAYNVGVRGRGLRLCTLGGFVFGFG